VFHAHGPIRDFYHTDMRLKATQYDVQVSGESNTYSEECLASKKIDNQS